MTYALRQVRSRKEVLKDTTVRDFSGGWNVIDNDLNLATRFSKVMENVVRKKDGSIGIRFGCRAFSDVATQSATTGSLTNPFSTTLGSAVVKVTHTSHNLITGHTYTISGVAAAVNGIPAGELNATHTVTVVDADNFNITVTTNATSTGSGAGGAVNYSHNNKTASGDIVSGIYFQDRAVVVTDDGVVLEIDSSGVSRVVFNTAIGNGLSGSPGGWSASECANFAVFNGELIIVNGVNKPLLCDFNRTPPTQPVSYLVDVPSGSNTNTPICKYVVAGNDYVLMAGDPLNEDRIHISNQGTSGTWVGDGAPNNAVTVDIGSKVDVEDQEITGIARFRNFIVASCADVSVVGTIGTLDSNGNHTPDFSDTVEGHGSLAHRTLVSLGDDLLMADNIGVPQLARGLFTGTITPSRASELIDPEIQAAVLARSVTATKERMWAVHHRSEGQYMLFVPNGDTPATTTETTVFVYTSVRSLKIKAWSKFTGWNFRCGFVSALKRLFMCTGTKMFIYGSDQDVITADYLNDTVLGDADGTGKNITFAWELPWTDFQERMKKKAIKYISFDTTGRAQFAVQLFVDKFYKDANGALSPVASTTFTGGDVLGFGGGTQPYGGGRRTRDERLWAWEGECKIAKFRFSGATKEALGIVSISVAYHLGSIRT